MCASLPYFWRHSPDLRERCSIAQLRKRHMVVFHSGVGELNPFFIWLSPQNPGYQFDQCDIVGLDSQAFGRRPERSSSHKSCNPKQGHGVPSLPKRKGGCGKLPSHGGIIQEGGTQEDDEKVRERFQFEKRTVAAEVGEKMSNVSFFEKVGVIQARPHHRITLGPSYVGTCGQQITLIARILQSPTVCLCHFNTLGQVVGISMIFK